MEAFFNKAFNGLPGKNIFLALLILTSLILYISFAREGLFSVDERGFLYLSRAVSERFSLDCSPYFSGFKDFGGTGIPTDFLIKDHDVYSIYSFGFPFLAVPFYRLLGSYGLQVLNILLTISTGIVVFFVSKKIWKDDNIAHISSVLYLFCTFSVFYALSLWYHPLIAFSFFLCSAIILHSRERIWITIFLISSAVCIWTAYYMIVPLAVLFLFLVISMNRNIGRLFIIMYFLAILSISWAYNAHIYSDTITGYYGSVAVGGISNLLKYFYGIIAMFFCRGCVTPELSFWANCQKSVLESSPFLIAVIPGFIWLHKKKSFSRPMKYVIASNLLYAGMIVYGKTNTFGGWELSMRYLLPIIPLLTIVGSGFIGKFFEYRFLYSFLVVSSLFNYFLVPVMPFDHFYYWIISLSLLVSLLLLFIWIFQSIPGRRRVNGMLAKIAIPMLLLSLIYSSNLINLNDVKIGNMYRLGVVEAERAIGKMTPQGSVVLVPRKHVYERVEVEGREILYYTGDNRGIVFRNILASSIGLNKSVYLVVVDDSDHEVFKNNSLAYIGDIGLNVPPLGNKLYLVQS